MPKGKYAQFIDGKLVYKATAVPPEKPTQWIIEEMQEMRHPPTMEREKQFFSAKYVKTMETKHQYLRQLLNYLNSYPIEELENTLAKDERLLGLEREDVVFLIEMDKRGVMFKLNGEYSHIQQILREQLFKRYR